MRNSAEQQDRPGRPQVRLRFPPDLWLFLAPRHRRAECHAAVDGTSSLGHVVEAAGVPLTEVGGLTVDGEPVGPGYRPRGGEVVRVDPVPRPQPVPSGAVRFLLDVHLGALARRLRLVGLDAAYRNDLADDELVERANTEGRVLLTKDRGLLRRRALRSGAYVRGALPDEQLRDVLDRFAPPLAPFTRCTACNGRLSPVPRQEVEEQLQPGTRRTYDAFARCTVCGHPYWKGAHHRRLEAVVASALRTVEEARRNAAERAGRGSVVETRRPARCDGGCTPGGHADSSTS